MKALILAVVLLMATAAHALTFGEVEWRGDIAGYSLYPTYGDIRDPNSPNKAFSFQVRSDLGWRIFHLNFLYWADYTDGIDQRGDDLQITPSIRVLTLGPAALDVRYQYRDKSQDHRIGVGLSW